ncbi:MAG TPA: hypothetical protein VI916_06855 [Acidimicrobiia bacterium]|nr:hypothetical protein [Acidimicrobiia bacterium]
MTTAALAAGVLGVVTAFVMYWLVVPGVLLGLAAVLLGVLGRRRVRSEAGTVAITLGVVAILAVPAFLSTADSAEEWGRDCALDPSHDSNC